MTIIRNEYPAAIPASPLDHERKGSICLDLQGMNAMRFIGLIGTDAFPGNESQRRGVLVREKTASGR